MHINELHISHPVNHIIAALHGKVLPFEQFLLPENLTKLVMVNEKIDDDEIT